MGQRIVIVDVGGMGREAAAWVVDALPGVQVLGFLDEDGALHGSEVGDLPVLGGNAWLEGRPDIEVVAALGKPAHRARLIAHLDAIGTRMATVIHPTATIGPRVHIEDGVIVCTGAVVIRDIAPDTTVVGVPAAPLRPVR